MGWWGAPTSPLFCRTLASSEPWWYPSSNMFTWGCSWYSPCRFCWSRPTGVGGNQARLKQCVSEGRALVCPLLGPFKGQSHSSALFSLVGVPWRQCRMSGNSPPSILYFMLWGDYFLLTSGEGRCSKVDVSFTLILGGVIWISHLAQVVKNLPASTRDVRSASSIPGSGRSPEEEMAIHSSILRAWRTAVHGVAKRRTPPKWLSMQTGWPSKYLHPSLVYVCEFCLLFTKETSLLLFPLHAPPK